MYHINNLLYRQNSISHSLSHFLKDESVASGIYEILKDILDFFHAGRAYIFEYEKDYTFQTCTYEVVAEGGVTGGRSIPEYTGYFHAVVDYSSFVAETYIVRVIV